MKKFDFVAELLAHGFHDDTKLEAVELSRQTGFEGVVLSRDFTKVIESVWSGRHEYSYRVEVFVNLTQNLCRANSSMAELSTSANGITPQESVPITQSLPRCKMRAWKSNPRRRFGR